MGFRFQKRIKIFKGLSLNLTMSGTSWTVGGKGVAINVRGDKLTGNAGIPGIGISYCGSMPCCDLRPTGVKSYTSPTNPQRLKQRCTIPLS